MILRLLFITVALPFLTYLFISSILFSGTQCSSFLHFSASFLFPNTSPVSVLSLPPQYTNCLLFHLRAATVCLLPILPLSASIPVSLKNSTPSLPLPISISVFFFTGCGLRAFFSWPFSLLSFTVCVHHLSVWKLLYMENNNVWQQEQQALPFSQVPLPSPVYHLTLADVTSVSGVLQYGTVLNAILPLVVMPISSSLSPVATFGEHHNSKRELFFNW